jgi:hypothetical protein
VSLCCPQLCCSATLLSSVAVTCIPETGERCNDLLLPSALLTTCVASASSTTPENRPENLILPALRRARKTLPSLPCDDVFYRIVSFLIPNPQHTLSLYTFIYQESTWYTGVLSAQSDRGFLHYRRVAFSSMLKSRVGNILVKVASLRINISLDGSSITSKSHTHPSQLSMNDKVTLVDPRRVDLSVLDFSLSSHRHS